MLLLPKYYLGRNNYCFHLYGNKSNNTTIYCVEFVVEDIDINKMFELNAVNNHFHRNDVLCNLYYLTITDVAIENSIKKGLGNPEEITETS